MLAAELVAHDSGVIGTFPRAYSDNQASAKPFYWPGVLSEAAVAARHRLADA